MVATFNRLLPRICKTELFKGAIPIPASSRDKRRPVEKPSVQKASQEKKKK
jgi:hypothetical protein